MPSNAIEKAETLAMNLAKATLRPHTVMKVRGHYYSVPSPILSPLALEALTDWMKRIEVSFEAEFDNTGHRLS